MSFANQTFRFVPIKAATTHKIYNVDSGLAGTEFSQALSSSTKQLMIRCREAFDVQFTFVSGESGTKYITIPKNATYKSDSLDLASSTLYMRVPGGASKTIEIEEWS
jgi:hypothetical protein